MNDEDAIRALIDSWLRETRAGNVEAVLELMAPDVIFLVAGQPPMVGRDAFARQLRGVLQEHAIESSSAIEEVVVSGDLAYCRTKLDIIITSKHGNTPMRRSGHTLSVLRKGDDGAWRLSRDANLVS
jgi:uncharacterized protein (TIGR02246 family)